MRVGSREDREAIDSSVLALQLPFAPLGGRGELVELVLHGSERVTELRLGERHPVAVQVSAGGGNVLNPLGACLGEPDQGTSEARRCQGTSYATEDGTDYGDKQCV